MSRAQIARTPSLSPAAVLFFWDTQNADWLFGNGACDNDDRIEMTFWLCFLSYVCEKGVSARFGDNVKTDLSIHNVMEHCRLLFGEMAEKCNDGGVATMVMSCANARSKKIYNESEHMHSYEGFRAVLFYLIRPNCLRQMYTVEWQMWIDDKCAQLFKLLRVPGIHMNANTASAHMANVIDAVDIRVIATANRFTRDQNITEFAETLPMERTYWATPNGIDTDE